MTGIIANKVFSVTIDETKLSPESILEIKRYFNNLSELINKVYEVTESDSSNEEKYDLLLNLDYDVVNSNSFGEHLRDTFYQRSGDFSLENENFYIPYQDPGEV